jgi:hypothetical protein
MMLDFVEDSKNKISYSTSFGHERGWFPPHVEKEVAYYIKKFNHISVRESSALQVLKRFGVQGEVLIDPAFLISKEEYIKISNTAARKTRTSYIFSYMMDPNEAKLKALRAVTSKLNLTNVSIPDRQMNYQEKIEKMIDFNVLEKASLEEWLWHFIHAEFVFTDSFHGLCFALIFEKPFICLANTMRGNTRFVSILNLLNLKERLVYDPNDICDKPELLEKLTEGVEFEPVREVLKYEREKAQQWLIKAIESEKETILSDYDILMRESNALRRRIVALERALEKSRKE